MNAGFRGCFAGSVRARWVITAIFAANGLLFGSWVPRIPDIRADLGLDVGALGVALLAPAVGSLLSMSLAGAAAGRFGSAAATRVSLTLFAVTPFLIGLAPNLGLLWLALFGWGISFGALDVAMNAQGVTVQRARGRATMSSLHAGFSFGGLVGAVLGSVAAGWQIPVSTALGGTGLVLLLVVLPATRWLLPDPPNVDGPAPLFARPGGRLLLLGAAAFAALACEGAAADWSAVYLREDLGSTPGLAGAGFVAFSVTMTAGRLAGDRVTDRFGGQRLLLLLAGVGGVGLAAGLLAGTAPVAVVGFALLGLGLSCMVPVLFSAAGQGPGSAGPAIAAVSTCGYVGFIAGPAMIGGLAQLSSLPAALWVLPVLTVTAGPLGRLGVRRSAEGFADGPRTPAPMAVPPPLGP